MKGRALAMTRAAAVLAGIWALLGLVGWIAGVLPPPAGGDRGRDVEDEEIVEVEESRDAGRVDAGEATATVTAAADAGTPAAEPSGPALARWAVCDAAVPAPAIATFQLVGSPTPELAIGCDGVVHVAAVDASGGGLRPVRIVIFDAEPTAGGALSIHAARPAAGDVDGDSLPDIVLPFWQSTGDGSTRGGRLYLVRRDETGAFGEPRLLGPIAAVDADLAQLDDRPGLDIVALNRGSELARRPSEGWVYAGGASPVRSAVLRGGLGGRAVAVADVDRDGHLDVALVMKEEPRTDVFFGDGTGRFPRSATATIRGGEEAVAADLDGDGGTDVLVRGEGLHLLRAGPADALEPQPIDAPGDLSGIAVADLDGDGKRDIAGISGGAVVMLRQTEDLAFEETRLVTIGGMSVQQLALSDLDGDGSLDAAVLVRDGGEGSAWELVLIEDVGRARDAVPATEAARLPDAPLVLRLALP